MVQLYTGLRKQTDALGMEMLVVGAMARDLVLVHGYGATIERGTRDVDFAISVVSWQDFTKLREQLLASEKFIVKKHLHEMEFCDNEGLPWEVDIVPFGDIAENHAIIWPPKNDCQMSVLGFEEALAAAIPVTIDTDVVINVASPAGICLLKLVAWTDRAVEKRAKDASDIRYLIESYAKIPLIFETLYDGGYMEARDWDETLASAIKLGEDAGVIASEDTVAVLHHQLFNNEKNKALFIRDMQSGKHVTDSDPAIKLLDLFIEGFVSN